MRDCLLQEVEDLILEKVTLSSRIEDAARDSATIGAASGSLIDTVGEWEVLACIWLVRSGTSFVWTQVPATIDYQALTSLLSVSGTG